MIFTNNESGMEIYVNDRHIIHMFSELLDSGVCRINFKTIDGVKHYFDVDSLSSYLQIINKLDSND